MQLILDFAILILETQQCLCVWYFVKNFIYTNERYMGKYVSIFAYETVSKHVFLNVMRQESSTFYPTKCLLNQLMSWNKL